MLPGLVRHGPGVWTFNTNHLKDFHFILLVTSFGNPEGQRNNHVTRCMPGGMQARFVFKILSVLFRKQVCDYCKCVFIVGMYPLLFVASGGEGEDVDQMLADTKSELEDAHRQHARAC